MKWICLIITLLITLNSCKTITIVDNIPQNSPKGYVEFYASWKYTLFKVEDGSITRIKKIRYGQRTRIEVEPGKHTFIVKIKRVQRDISVNVLEEMISPIRIETKLLYSDYNTSTYEFLPLVSVNPIPATINSENIEQFISALSDSAVFTRSIAVNIIGRNPEGANELILDILKDISEYDPNIILKAEAIKCLKSISNYQKIKSKK